MTGPLHRNLRLHISKRKNPKGLQLKSATVRLGLRGKQEIENTRPSTSKSLMAHQERKSISGFWRSASPRGGGIGKLAMDSTTTYTSAARRNGCLAVAATLAVPSTYPPTRWTEMRAPTTPSMQHTTTNNRFDTKGA